MKGLLVPVVLVLVFLALVANLLAFTVFNERIPPEILSWIVGGIGAAAGLFINLLGLRLTTKTIHKRSRSPVVWLRRGFLVGAILVALIVADSFVERSWVPADKWKVGALLILLNVGPFFALMASQKEYVRAAARESSSTRARH